MANPERSDIGESFFAYARGDQDADYASFTVTDGRLTVAFADGTTMTLTQLQTDELAIWLAARLIRGFSSLGNPGCSS